MKAFPQLTNLGCDGGGIARIAFEDFHRHRTSFRIGQQAEDDLPVAAAFIARMAKACEWAAAVFKVSRAHVIENQGTFRKVPFGESIDNFAHVFDRKLEELVIGPMDRNSGQVVRFLDNPDVREFVTRLMRNQVYSTIQREAKSRAAEV